MKQRQDGWTGREDQLLKEKVLHHIRNGSTQLNAFEEVGDLVNRTAAACGFRWNSCLRKENQALISAAKKERYSKRKEEEQKKSVSQKPASNYPQEELIKRMEQWILALSKKTELTDLEKRCEAAEQLAIRLEKENEQLNGQLKELEEDYRVLLFLIEKARKLGTDEQDQNATVFKMETNGNLYRMDRKTDENAVEL
ncbi:RsfA family transcriptional regulator [Jeotgalibacillus sp. R-1-5s-1]|uniref:RsfA family transcriptional regulator n=1 Tax=Jeotgalibacillus sp. R-1-5s-1 TaxID=2555897 RepID=UPI00106D89E4|nr:RsfA family transcriptional regulator [Jeotgalibacillus sp. R-1-5s-1]TFE03589.1 RsfA family transcriptional regulator [Jeotgalibacillus sp. R-1-5s-1]